MRLRNVKGSKQRVLKEEYVTPDPCSHRGMWHEVFGNENEIYIEIGTGKGQFIMQLAEKNPDKNYIGIEKYSSVLVKAIDKQNQAQLPNLRFIRMDATDLEDVFDYQEVSGIYLNFSDPWPKDRHAKRRLTSKEFLRRYDEILDDDGFIEFKTDNDDLFNFSHEEVVVSNFKVSVSEFDLYKSEYVKDNIPTEYEEKFHSMGMPIHFMRLTKKY